MRRSGPFTLGIVMLTGLLAACAPDPGPDGGPTSSPTPAPTAVAEPGARVPLSCEQLIPPADREPVIGPDPLVVPDERWLSSSVAPETAGVRVCTWGVPDGLDALRFTITADPADVAQFGPVNSQNAPFEEAPVGSIGDGSHIACGMTLGGTASCTYSVLAGPYWFGGYARTDAVTPEAAAAAVSTMATTIVERLAAAPPTPLGTPPQRPAVDNDCSWMDTDGAVAVAIGATAADLAYGSSGPPTDTLQGLYSERVGSIWCAIHGYDNGLALEYVAGSGWAWESAADGWSPVSVAGATGAASFCSPDREWVDCSVRALVGDTIVQADSSGSSESEALERTLAGLTAAIPFLPLEP